MKRVAERFGGPEVLRVVEEDDVRPRAGEVAVKVLAAGVSFTDQLIRAGAPTSGDRSHHSRPATSWSASSKSSVPVARCDVEIASPR